VLSDIGINLLKPEVACFFEIRQLQVGMLLPS